MMLCVCVVLECVYALCVRVFARAFVRVGVCVVCAYTDTLTVASSGGTLLCA